MLLFHTFFLQTWLTPHKKHWDSQIFCGTIILTLFPQLEWNLFFFGGIIIGLKDKKNNNNKF